MKLRPFAAGCAAATPKTGKRLSSVSDSAVSVGATRLERITYLAGEDIVGFGGVGGVGGMWCVLSAASEWAHQFYTDEWALPY